MSRELVLGKYQIDKVLGKGAMGVVFGAFDPSVARKVAIKTIRKDLLQKDSQSDEILERFNREARAAARLNHPNVVTIYELGEDKDLAYIAMEFIVGESLQELMARCGRLPFLDAIDIANQLLDALDYAHQHDVVHRDIKPANLMVDAKGLLKVTDFGIARLDASELTQLGTVMGSPSYMSPEQIKGLVVDGRADLFSAAVILFDMLTGQRPFTGNMAMVMDKVINHPHPKPSSINSTLPEVFDGLFQKALAKEPEQRFRTGKEFRDALRSAVQATQPATVANNTSSSPDDVATTVIIPRQDLPTEVQTSNDERSFHAAKTKMLQDIEAFSRSFDLAQLRAIDERNARPKRAAWIKFPELDPSMDVDRVLTEVTQLLPSIAPVAEPVVGGGLLERLKREASVRQALDGQRVSLQMHQKRLVSEALQNAFHYLRDFCESLNILKPTRPGTYSLLNMLRIDNLVWREGSADFRVLSSATDDPLLELVIVRFRLGNGQTVCVERETPSHTMIRNVLSDNNLTFEEQEVHNGRNQLVSTRFMIACDVKVDVKLVADYETGNIHLTHKNVQRFGSNEYTLSPETLTQEALEEMASLLLGKESRFESICRGVE
jgi:serine/threonine protein kinase